MTPLKWTLAVVFSAYAGLLHAQTYQAGMADLEIADDRGSRDLEGFVWYPTEATGPVSFDFESAVWESSQVLRDAAPARGLFPLVVVSHGMFGNPYNQAWLAARLAREGFVVAAVSHPGTSTWARDPDDSRQLWERPRDISRLIDFATAAWDMSDRIDPERIFMAGHSLGGFTAVALAGGRYDAAGFDAFCAAAPGDMVCGILDGWHIAKTAPDRAQMEADLSDPRIKAFAVFDLGGTQSFSVESLGQIDKPMLVFGAPITNSGLTLEIESRALIEALPAATNQYIEPDTLSHFDFLGQCKPGGLEILEREEPGDEIICMRGGEDRALKHEMITDAVVGFFSRP